jgi:hypothetical protein
MLGNWKHALRRARVLAIAAIATCTLISALAWRAWFAGPNEHDYLTHLLDHPSPVTLEDDAQSRVVAFCSDCHALPRPESFPRDAWHDGVRMGYEYYVRSGRNDLDPPPIELARAYYRSRAPEKLTFPEPKEAGNELRAAFVTQQFASSTETSLPPAVAHLRWVRLEPDGPKVLILCDMRSGEIAAIDLRDRRSPSRLLGRLNNPCHVEPCDLDNDGAVDLVVADLGSFFPYDHDRGRVVWLRRREQGRSFEQVVLFSGRGRVADARPADFDGDGDVDLIVAEFGHYLTGGVVLLRNVAARGEQPRFETEQLDSRPGTIHTPVHDFNEDGRPDFLALVSQEHESLDVFLSHPDVGFRLQTLWTAPDLTFGSSGIELVDLDEDGDVDVLSTNGDSFDNSYISPSHGVQWFENLGGLQFADHRLTDMPGAYRALAGDVDLDGDLDVLAVAWLPPQIRPPDAPVQGAASILCLEQTSPGEFIRHTLETDSPYHATAEMADFDDDGDLDLAVGTHVMTSLLVNTPDTPSRLAVWWNQVIADGD